MKTKKIFMRWKLKNLPTPSDIATLIDKGVITKEEAREILFNPEEIDERSVESLKEEIKFLRELVEKLSNQNYSKVIEIIKEVEKPVYYRYPWWQSYYTWIPQLAAGISAITSVNNSSAATGSTFDFTSIKTF